jgi:hypothetical protein
MDEIEITEARIVSSLGVVTDSNLTGEAHLK